MKITSFKTYRFVKGEDLNHHGTLFAGRAAEWFVETGLMSASQILPPDNIVCVQLNGMKFTSPIHLGDLVEFESRIVRAGRTSIVAYVTGSVNTNVIISGFITYVNTDKNGRPLPHGLTIEAETEEEKSLQEKAAALPRM